MSLLRVPARVLFSGLFVIAVGCGPGPQATPGDGPDGGTVDAPLPPLEDTDGDGIADEHEGVDEETDTDEDGTPDYMDADSDDDGISDADESGDGQTQTTPPDSDGDGIPDFQDPDSDNNGIPDGVDGTEDLDGDGDGDFADDDDDGDGLSDEEEIGGDPNAPVDSDGDDTPDYQDTDSDNDDISDDHEGIADPDMDDVPAYLDDDSDADGLPDVVEGGDDSLTTRPVDTDSDGTPDFLDFDADNDGIRDGDEDANGNGIVDDGETDPTNSDSDGDGATDLVEGEAGTDPTDSNDNPQANGDFVFVVPYEDPATPDKDDLDFATDLKIVDVYVLVDLSGSMNEEFNALVDNLDQALQNLSCATNPSDPGCIADLFSGAGTIGYAGGNPYTNELSIQSDPAQPGIAIDNNDGPGGGSSEEATLAALWATVTGLSATDLDNMHSCSVNSFRGPTCAGGGVGYPCFREGALPVILLATDEQPLNGNDTESCPGLSTVASAANAIGAKVVGIQGDAAGGGSDDEDDVRDELEQIAEATDAVDGAGNPFVFKGDGANAADAIEDAVRDLAANIPLDMSATSVDDPADSVDAVVAFVDHLETLQLGTAECADGLTDQDTNSDTFPDRYVDVQPGTPVCWRLFPKMNTTVMPTAEPQLFKATVEVYGDGVTLLDTREVFFLVPPEIATPDPE